MSTLLCLGRHTVTGLLTTGGSQFRDRMPPSPATRISTQQALHQLRAEIWGRGLGLDNISGIASTSPPATTKPEKLSFSLAFAVCYANA